VTALRERGEAPELEVYLRSLWSLADAWRARATVPLAEVAQALARALTEPPPPFDEGWRELDLFEADPVATFADWERILQCQVLDLRDMAADGSLANEMRYFGSSVRRTGRERTATPAYWFNFDPLTYLECGVCGAFGGWEDGDETGRMLVPGKVAVLGPDGTIEAIDAKDIADDPIVDLSEMIWADLARLLYCGQSYE
jgi:hypothetical protein